VSRDIAAAAILIPPILVSLLLALSLARSLVRNALHEHRVALRGAPRATTPPGSNERTKANLRTLFCSLVFFSVRRHVCSLGRETNQTIHQVIYLSRYKNKRVPHNTIETLSLAFPDFKVPLTMRLGSPSGWMDGWMNGWMNQVFWKDRNMMNFFSSNVVGKAHKQDLGPLQE
jgi:hypothetical protein